MARSWSNLKFSALENDTFNAQQFIISQLLKQHCCNGKRRSAMQSDKTKS